MSIVDENYRKNATSTGFFQNFKRSHQQSVDGNLFEINVLNVEEIPSISRIDDISYILGSNKITHRKYPILTRWISNYVYLKGVYVVTNHWSPEKDSIVSDYEQNLYTDPELKNIYSVPNNYVTINFDWTNRIYTTVVDLSLRPKNVFMNQNVNWVFDGAPTIMSSSDSSLEGACIVARNPFGWKTKSLNINNGSVVYTRPNVENVYMFTYLNSLQVNGNTVEPYKYFKVESESLEISAGDEAAIIIKESVS